ncbi:MAG: adenylate/guanylate cyclase domain-containing protein [Anaerolineae bacterium]|nr:adenylate/guanylate cyclase domain-containing protein [Anaerolineae bacterium]
MNLRTFFAYDLNDTDEIRLEKFAAFLVAGSCCLAAIVWTAMYYIVFGWGLTTLLPLSFAILVGFSLFISHITKNHKYAIYTQIICILYIPTFIQWSIGGVFDSGFVLAWAFLGPICALMFFPVRKSIPWFLLFLLNVVITVILNDFFVSRGQVVSEDTRLVFFIMNLSISSIVIYIFASYYVAAAVRERDNANKLLLNILPKEIASILKKKEGTIADRHESASVLFADIAGSTPLFSNLDPGEVVNWLNEIFSMFDNLVDKYGLEKIKTIGDNYMVASGVPTPRPDHAQALAHFALDMLACLKDIPARNKKQIEFRVGINSGPLVAGVIGKRKFQYDLWGDTVNVASRMESHGEVGKVHISKASFELLKDDFDCLPRGSIPIHGKGSMETWYLISQKA